MYQWSSLWIRGNAIQDTNTNPARSGSTVITVRKFVDEEAGVFIIWAYTLRHIRPIRSDGLSAHDVCCAWRCAVKSRKCAHHSGFHMRTQQVTYSSIALSLHEEGWISCLGLSPAQINCGFGRFLVDMSDTSWIILKAGMVNFRAVFIEAENPALGQ